MGNHAVSIVRVNPLRINVDGKNAVAAARVQVQLVRTGAAVAMALGDDGHDVFQGGTVQHQQALHKEAVLLVPSYRERCGGRVEEVVHLSKKRRQDTMPPRGAKHRHWCKLQHTHTHTHTTKGGAARRCTAYVRARCRFHRSCSAQ